MMDRSSFSELEEDQKIGVRKGICGYSNSCYLDTTLFCLFSETTVFDSILLRLEDNQSTVVNAIISRLNIIAAALREPPYYCDSTITHEFRHCLKALNYRMVDHMMDVEEFLYTLLDKALKTEKFIKYYCGEKQSSNNMHQILLNITLYDLNKVNVSNLQSLLDQSMELQNLKFVCVPDPALIIKMPRSDGELAVFDAIRPNLTLNITHLIANTDKQDKDLKVTLDLNAVICLRHKHYTAFVRQFEFEKYRWVYFDSMAYQAYSEVRKVNFNFEETLTWDDLSFFCLKDDEHMHLTKDIHLCIYTPPRKQMNLQKNLTEEKFSESLKQEGQNNDLDLNIITRYLPEQEQDYSDLCSNECTPLVESISVDSNMEHERGSWIVRFLKGCVFTGGTGKPYSLWPRIEKETFQQEIMNKKTFYGQGIEERESGNSLNSILFALFYDTDLLTKVISENSKLPELELLQKAYPIFKSLQNKVYVNWEQSLPLRSYMKSYFFSENPPAVQVATVILKEVCNLDIFGMVPNDYYFQATGKPENYYPPVPPPYRIPFENVLTSFFDFHYPEFERMQFPILILSTIDFYPFKPFATLQIDMDNITQRRIPGYMDLFAVICLEHTEYSAYIRRESNNNHSKSWWYYDSDYSEFELDSLAKISELPKLESWFEEIERKMRKGNCGSIGTFGPWDQVLSSLPVGHCKRILESSVVCVYVSSR